jgi:hypothetical protein
MECNLIDRFHKTRFRNREAGPKSHKVDSACTIFIVELKQHIGSGGSPPFPWLRPSFLGNAGNGTSNIGQCSVVNT